MINVEPIMVEVQRLNVHPGDVVLVTPKFALTNDQQSEMLHQLQGLTRRTKIEFVLKSPDIDVTVIAKEQA